MPPTLLKRDYSLLINSNVELKFLLPNGLIIPLTLNPELSLEEAKSKLWTVAAEKPLFDILQPKGHYVFCGINRETAEEEEFYDQSRCLRELHILLPYLRVIEAAKDSALLEVNTRNATIASCIGISHTDIVRAGRLNPEVNWARLRLLRLAKLHAKGLTQRGLDGLARYLMAAPQRVPTRSLKNMLQKLTNLRISAWVLDGKDPPQKRLIFVELNVSATVLDAIQYILHIQLELAKPDCYPVIRDFGTPNPSNYLLKVCCSHAYLFETNHQLITYEYIQDCIEQYQVPCLSPILRRDIEQSLKYYLCESNRTHFCELNCMSRFQPLADIRTHRRFVPKRSNLLGRPVFSSDSTEGNTTATNNSNNNSNSTTDSSFSFYGELKSLVTALNEDLHDLTDYDYVLEEEDKADVDHLKRSRTDDQPIVSLWELAGYFCIFVRSGQFLMENTLPSQNSGHVITTVNNVSSQSAASHSNLQANLSNCNSVNTVSSNTMTSSSISLLQGSYFVRVGLFHGSQSLIECQTTSEMPGAHLIWNKWLNFHIFIKDIPPAARLCVALIRTERNIDRRNVKTYEYPCGWANLNLFDHQGFMVTNDVTLRLWPASLAQSTDGRFHRLHPAGTVLENPNPEVTLQIKIFNPIQGRIQRPTLNTFINAYRQTRSTSSSVHQSPSTTAMMTHGNDPLQPPLAMISRPHTLMTGFTNQVFDAQELEADIEDCSLINSATTFEDQLTINSNYFLNNSKNLQFVTKEVELLLRDLVNRDPLYELCEQDKVALWTGRYFCLKHLPAALPWLTQAVCWYRRDSMMEFYYLVHAWPRPLDIGIALQLIGAMGLSATAGNEISTNSNVAEDIRGGASGIADSYVRELAVSSLHNLSDAELSDYLLQLVQALKAEAYLDNALTRFILYRALKNPLQIGLKFFWHLRSEIHLPDVRLRFGLLLEAFCHGCGPLLVSLSKQVTALNRLEAISVRLKQLSTEEDQRVHFREELARPEASRDLQGLFSPLCLSEKLGDLVIKQCNVKRSKKRPLWLVWTNSDHLASYHHKYHYLIFKHGDDLRQDMLTLQLLRVMDRIWKEEGMDMCLMPYGCLATGPEMGLIETVRDARTVMSIQGERLTAALQIDCTQLYKWLMQQQQQSKSTNDSVLYERMIHTFTMSCAGYCVATFILGIRDRHPDNIMIDKTGRLFHIDFGHILDKRKKKFGIVRERVPFVLTKDFITIIARGNMDNAVPNSASNLTITGNNSGNSLINNPYFQDFTKLCGRAYLVLRKHSNLLLTLLAMMLPSGLPELSSVCDLDYVRKTLAVEMDDAKALAYFHAKFNEAYQGAWTTKIDWFSHWMNT